MSHGKLDFALNIGASFKVALTWLFPDDPTDPNSEFNTPQDLTGWTGEIVCPSLAGFPLALTLGGTAGTIDGTILDTTSWAGGRYNYQLKMTAPDSTVDIILVGRICVNYVPQF